MPLTFREISLPDTIKESNEREKENRTEGGGGGEGRGWILIQKKKRKSMLLLYNLHFQHFQCIGINN